MFLIDLKRTEKVAKKGMKILFPVIQCVLDLNCFHDNNKTTTTLTTTATTTEQLFCKESDVTFFKTEKFPGNFLGDI